MAKGKSKYSYELKNPNHWEQSVKGQFDLYGAILDAKNFLIQKADEKRKQRENENKGQKKAVKKTVCNKRNGTNNKKI